MEGVGDNQSRTSPLVRTSNALVVRDGREILDIPGLDLPHGQTVGLMGPNGAGKTTFLHVLGSILPLTRGRVEYGSQWDDTSSPIGIRHQIGMVLQDSLLLDCSVLANVALGPRLRGIGRKGADSSARDALELLKIPHLAPRHPRTLSGGEAQRVSLARALACRPLLLLMDEPFSSIDVIAKSQIIADLRPVIRDLCLTVVVISHDFSEVKALAHRLVVLENGKVVSDASPEVSLTNPPSPVVAALVGRY